MLLVPNLSLGFLIKMVPYKKENIVKWTPFTLIEICVIDWILIIHMFLGNIHLKENEHWAATVIQFLSNQYFNSICIKISETNQWTATHIQYQLVKIVVVGKLVRYFPSIVSYLLCYKYQIISFLPIQMRI